MLKICGFVIMSNDEFRRIKGDSFIREYIEGHNNGYKSSKQDAARQPLSPNMVK